MYIYTWKTWNYFYNLVFYKTTIKVEVERWTRVFQFLDHQTKHYNIHKRTKAKEKYCFWTTWLVIVFTILIDMLSSFISPLALISFLLYFTPCFYLYFLFVMKLTQMETQNKNSSKFYHFWFIASFWCFSYLSTYFLCYRQDYIHERNIKKILNL